MDTPENDQIKTGAEEFKGYQEPTDTFSKTHPEGTQDDANLNDRLKAESPD